MKHLSHPGLSVTSEASGVTRRQRLAGTLTARVYNLNEPSRLHASWKALALAYKNIAPSSHTGLWDVCGLHGSYL